MLNVIEDALAPSHRNILLCVPLLLLEIDVVPVTVNVPVLEIYISAVPVPVAELLSVRLPLIVAVALAPFTRYITFAAPEAVLFIVRSAPKVFDEEPLARYIDPVPELFAMTLLTKASAVVLANIHCADPLLVRVVTPVKVLPPLDVVFAAPV